MAVSYGPVRRQFGLGTKTTAGRRRGPLTREVAPGPRELWDPNYAGKLGFEIKPTHISVDGKYELECKPPSEDSTSSVHTFFVRPAYANARSRALYERFVANGGGKVELDGWRDIRAREEQATEFRKEAKQRGLKYKIAPMTGLASRAQISLAQVSTGQIAAFTVSKWFARPRSRFALCVLESDTSVAASFFGGGGGSTDTEKKKETEV